MTNNWLSSLCIISAILIATSCTQTNTTSGTSSLSSITPTDTLATPATTSLLNRLYNGQKLLVGHQDDLSYGHTWYEIEGRSDMKEVCGIYPDICGWELGGLELGDTANLDNVGYNNMRRHMQEMHRLGGINTMTWHSYNIITGNNCWDVSVDGVVAAILPDGAKHAQYLRWLDRFADFASTIRDDEGELIPLLFRPYHELIGSWFWWGRDLCTADEYKQLWRMTHNYLTQEKGLHNLLYVYSTSNFNDAPLFLERYPGDDVVDILGFDIYQYGDDLKQAQQEFLKQLKLQSDLLSAIAKEKNKPWAVCEAGLESCLLGDWFSELGKTIIPTDARYILFWRNAHDRNTHFYIPFDGHEAAPDFKKFVDATR